MKLAPRLLVFLLFLAVAWCLDMAQLDRAAQQRQERLAKHADLYMSIDRGRPVDQVPANSKGEVDLSLEVFAEYEQSPASLTPEKELQDLAKLAQAVVEATAVQRYSALTPRRSFLYSDWDLEVTRVFKNTSPIPIQPGGTITVVRPGGELIVNGRRVVARVLAGPNFTLGQRSLVYLFPLLDTQSFDVLANGMFELTSGGPRPLFVNGYDARKMRAFCASLSVGDFLAAVERSISE
jgi:hypothetical protein